MSTCHHCNKPIEHQGYQVVTKRGEFCNWSRCYRAWAEGISDQNERLRSRGIEDVRDETERLTQEVDRLELKYLNLARSDNRAALKAEIVRLRALSPTRKPSDILIASMDPPIPGLDDSRGTTDE